MQASDAIFLLGDDGRLEKVPYTAYSTEDVLQELIEKYPELIVGEQVDPDDPPRWLLVSREAGIPDAEASSDRWSLDHLLLDHRGIPTLVEVKRSSDTRIRREVIGQMLDYAANATRYWPTDRIRTWAATREGGVEALDQRIRELQNPGAASPDEDVEPYWKTVEENLRGGNLRLLFVADELPRELRRVIEFLNEQMQHTEVLGVEVRHYAGSGMRALVPRVIGQTQRARDVKAPSAGVRKTDEASFLSVNPPDVQSFFKQLLEQARAEGHPVSWGGKGFSVRVARSDGNLVSVLYGYPAGSGGYQKAYVEVYFGHLGPEVDQTPLRDALRALGGYREGGKHTFRLFLDEETLPAAYAGLPHVWSFYRMLRDQRTASEISSSGDVSAP